MERAKANDNEPVFMLRARDVYSGHALVAYLEACRNGGCSSEHIKEIEECVDMFARWKLTHPSYAPSCRKDD